MSSLSNSEFIFSQLANAIQIGDLDLTRVLHRDYLRAMIDTENGDTSSFIIRNLELLELAVGSRQLLLVRYFLSPEGGSADPPEELFKLALPSSNDSGAGFSIFRQLLNPKSKFLICSGNEPTDVLHECLVVGSMPAILALISHGVYLLSPCKPIRFSINRVPWGRPLGLTPLDSAACSGNPEVIDLILSYGADLVDCNALHVAATSYSSEVSEQSHVCMIRHLLKKGMDIDKIEHAGNMERTEKYGCSGERPLGTSLHYAIRRARVHRVKVLLEMGANTAIEATNGDTPRQWAEHIKSRPEAYSMILGMLDSVENR